MVNGITFYHGVTGGRGCSACPAGFYQPISGGTTCLPCKSGEWAWAWGDHIYTALNRISGQSFKVSPTDRTNSLSRFILFISFLLPFHYIHTGTYSSLPGNRFCTPCDPGTASNIPGQASSCPPCNVNWFAPHSGMLNCMWVWWSHASSSLPSCLLLIIARRYLNNDVHALNEAPHYPSQPMHTINVHLFNFYLLFICVAGGSIPFGGM